MGASRGLHVDDIKLVVNLHFPQEIPEYVHRIGRTGRAGNKGKAYTFFDIEEDAHHARKLIKVLEATKQKVPAELRTYQNVTKNDMKNKKKAAKKKRMQNAYQAYGGGGQGNNYGRGGGGGLGRGRGRGRGRGGGRGNWY